MHQPIRRIVPAAVVVLLSSCGAVPGAPGDVAEPTPGAQSSRPAATPAPSVPASTDRVDPARRSTTTEPADSPAPTTPGASEVGAASFRDGYAHLGVEVRVSRIKRTTLGGEASAAGADRGDPIQILTVRVTNRTGADLVIATPMSTMTYGAHRHAAAVVHAEDLKGLHGTIRPGRTQTARLGFAVPRAQLNEVTLTVGLGTRNPPAVFTGSIEYAPSDDVVFNDPTGSKARQLAITRHIERSIDAAPKGSTIRIVQYSFDIQTAADKLVAAHRRGVHVQMIIDQHDQVVTPQTMQLVDELGESRRRKSFLIRCGASCMSNRPSTMHAKYYLFSSVGPVRRVAMVSSANITHTNSQGSWNDIQTIVGNATIYDSLTRYFVDMASDDNDRNYYRTTTSGPYMLYFFPRAAQHRIALLEALDHVSCSGAATGYGTRDGHTVVQVTMYSWRGPRIDIARLLWKLHDQGCTVDVILNSGRTDLAIKRVLTARSAKHGVMQIRDAWVDRNGNNAAERYMHQKGITINGVWAGNPTSKVVFSGSQNFAPLSTTDNNEIILRHIDDSTYDAYAENFRYVVANGTRPLW